MFWNDYFCCVVEKCWNGMGICKSGSWKIKDFNKIQAYKFTQKFLNYFHKSAYEEIRGPKSLQNFVSLLAKLVYFHESTHEVFKISHSWICLQKLVHFHESTLEVFNFGYSQIYSQKLVHFHEFFFFCKVMRGLKSL